jgi:hypothetical protein
LLWWSGLEGGGWSSIDNGETGAGGHVERDNDLGLGKTLGKGGASDGRPFALFCQPRALAGHALQLLVRLRLELLRRLLAPQHRPILSNACHCGDDSGLPRTPDASR